MSNLKKSYDKLLAGWKKYNITSLRSHSSQYYVIWLGHFSNNIKFTYYSIIYIQCYNVATLFFWELINLRIRETSILCVCIYMSVKKVMCGEVVIVFVRVWIIHLRVLTSFVTWSGPIKTFTWTIKAVTREIKNS